MSPVEIWGMPNFSLMNVACVPLPAPGAPNRIKRIVASRVLDLLACCTRCVVYNRQYFWPFFLIRGLCDYGWFNLQKTYPLAGSNIFFMVVQP
jgi:hypothetical protein